MKKDEFLKKHNLENNPEAIQDLEKVLSEKSMPEGWNIITEEDIKASKSYRIDPVKGNQSLTPLLKSTER